MKLTTKQKEQNKKNKSILAKNRITAIIDTREQIPLDLERHGLTVIRDTLRHGDYSLAQPNLRDILSIERKSLADLVQCVAQERKRFEYEVRALRGYKYKFIIVECNLADIYVHNYQSKTHPNAVVASIARWMSLGIPFVFAGDRVLASEITAKILKFVAVEIMDYAKPLAGG